MQVIFQTKSKEQNRYSIASVPGFGRVYFNKGVKVTTDKDLIKALLKHTLYERGDYTMVSNEEMVSKYLEGETSDKLTEEILNRLSIEGIKTLGKVLQTKSTQPVLIKAEVEGKPITNKVQEVIDYYSLKEDNLQPVKEYVEEFQAPLSSNMTAQEAVEHIITTPQKNLDGFLADDEQRKTVLKAWEQKMENR